MDSQWVAIVVLTALDLLFAVLLLAFARELGVILVRLGPATVRPDSESLPIGERVAPIIVRTLDSLDVAIAPTKAQVKLLVFVAPKCEACSQLVPGLRTLASSYAGLATVLAVSSGENSPDDYAYARSLAPVVPYACDKTLFEQFKVHATPFVFLLDAQNVIRAKGIANSLQHLESVFSLEVRQLRGSPAMSERADEVVTPAGGNP